MAAPPPDALRRALLRGRPRTPAPMRPPWALPEAEFLEACLRCGECLGACPERILRRGDGGFPVVDFSAAECTFCRACVAVCRPRALDAMREPWSWRAAVQPSCLAARGVLCQSCRDACPHAALAFPPLSAVARPRIDPARCNGCGACVRACPAAAIGMRQAGEAAA